MIPRLTTDVILIASALLLVACSNDPRLPERIAAQKLTQRPLGTYPLTVSVPDDYEVSEHEGVDFTTYWIGSRQKSAAGMPGGGIYVGNHPRLHYEHLQPVETVAADVLGKRRRWNIYQDQGTFKTEIHVKNRGDDSWDMLIHLYGRAREKEDVYRVIHWFSTLKRAPRLKSGQ